MQGKLIMIGPTSQLPRKTPTSKSIPTAKTSLEAARDKMASIALLDSFQCVWLVAGFILWACNAGHVDKTWNTCPDYCDVPTDLTETFGFGLSIILGVAIGCKCISIWNCYTLGRAAYEANSRRQAEDLTFSWRAFNIASSFLGPLAFVFYGIFLVLYFDLPSILFLFQQSGSLLALMYDFLCRIEFHRAVDRFINEIDMSCKGRRENVV